MTTKSKELVTLTFEGPNFAEHGLEIDVLSELLIFKRIIVSGAEELWRKAHPDRKRLPKGYSDGIRIKLFSFEKGSCVAPLYHERHPGQVDFTEEDHVEIMADLLIEGIAAANNDMPLPAEFPKPVIPIVAELGNTLGDEDRIISRSHTLPKGALYNNRTQRIFQHKIHENYHDNIKLIGEVRAADLDGRNFTIRLQTGEKVSAKFLAEHEDLITDALRDHVTTRITVEGEGLYSSDNASLLRISSVDSIDLHAPEEKIIAGEQDEKPAWKTIVELGGEIPKEKWSTVPDDLSSKLDVHLYGTSQVDE